jgi:hypothetical protein
MRFRKMAIFSEFSFSFAFRNTLGFENTNYFAFCGIEVKLIICYILNLEGKGRS